MQPPPNQRLDQRRKAFDTLSTVGAGAAGIGLGLLLPADLKPIAGWLLAVGLVAHLCGMFGRHRLDRQQRDPTWWESLVYWGCWAAIIAFGVYALWRGLAVPSAAAES